MALITFSGLASGIDSTALIEATLEQERTTRIVPYENEVSEREETNNTLTELKTLLNELSTSVQSFRTLNGGGIAKQASSSDETVVTAIASNGAQSGTYTLSITQLAQNATFSFDDRYTTETATINSSINDGAVEADRTVSFTIGDGASSESISIALTSSSTTSDFVSEFNTQSNLATASIVNVGTSSSASYALIIQSNTQGLDEGEITLDSVGTEIQTAGTGAFLTNDLDQATDLQFTLSGITGTITRSSNTVTDVLDGVSFTASDTGSATISINNDPAASESLVEDFVDKYNEVITYIAENDLITDSTDSKEGAKVFGALTDTSLDENLITSLRNALSDASVSGRTVNILADLGVTTERDGTLAFDSDTFQNAVSDDAEGVELILSNLGENLGAVDGTIAQYTRFNGLIDESVSSNTDRISSLQDQILDLEDALARQETILIQQFARLESQISNLQSQQSSLTSLLPQQ